MFSKEKKVNLGNIQQIKKKKKKASIVGRKTLSFYWMVWWKPRRPGEHSGWQTILCSDKGNVAQALLPSLYSADKHVTGGAAALF